MSEAGGQRAIEQALGADSRGVASLLRYVGEPLKRNG